MDITFEKVGYIYQKGTPFQNRALQDMNLCIKDGQYTALVGHTGSGKSTVLQHLNALMQPTEGTVIIGERVITDATDNKGLKAIRKKVGIVFQFPESQLFEETVEKDICFGPMNFGVSESDAREIAKKMVALVGLDESVLSRSPFELSGGQMRRVAIAGVLAMEPEVLVLDEPTAGLDPKGRRDIMDMFNRLHQDEGMTIVLVTHNMDDVANYADEMIVLENGTAIKQGKPTSLFLDVAWLQKLQLDVPTAVSFAELFEEQTGKRFSKMPLNEEQLADEIMRLLEMGEEN